MEKKLIKNFVALYRGYTLSSAHLIAATEDPNIVLQAASILDPKTSINSSDDVVHCLEESLKTALDIIKDEAAHQARKESMKNDNV